MRTVKEDQVDQHSDPSFVSREVSRAEFHLNRDVPRPGTVALAVGAFVLLIVTKAASAAIIPPALATVVPDNCSTHLKTLQFAGTFNLKNPRNPGAEPLRFVIGEPDGPSKGSAVAQIWSGNHCQASCSSIDFEQGDMSMPISLDLQCRGEELGPLSAHVAVLWDHGNAHSTLLRFGSWLEGYEQATMKVEVDHFNTLNVAGRADLNMPTGSKRTTVAFEH